MGLRRLSKALLGVLLLSVAITSFQTSLTRRKAFIPSTEGPKCAAVLRSEPRPYCRRICWATPENSNDAGETQQEVVDNAKIPNDDTEGGITRTLLLAVPLFCKFVIVLLIKFVTDLIVFPLLFLYRVARLMKRKILKLLFHRDPVNGSS